MKFESRQQLFDHVAKHLLTQKEKAQDGNYCKYRDRDGRRCAVGACIPDSLYRAAFETIGIESLMEKYPEIRELFPERSAVLLSNLQLLHDNCETKDWARHLTNLAEGFGLVPYTPT